MNDSDAQNVKREDKRSKLYSCGIVLAAGVILFWWFAMTYNPGVTDWQCYDTNKDEKLTREKILRSRYMTDRIYTFYDTDGDGALTRNEFDSGSNMYNEKKVVRVLELLENPSEKTLTIIDVYACQDGVIRKTCVSAELLWTDWRLAALKLDADGDGVITKEEIQAVAKRYSRADAL